MSFLGAAWEAIKLGREYSGAVDTAAAVLRDGGSVTSALRAFALATEGKLDDDLVEKLDTGIRQAIGYAQRGASVAGRVAGFVEEHGSVIGATIRQGCAVVECRGPAVIEAARRIGARADELGDKAQDVASEAGVLCVRASVRLQRLLG